MLVGCDQDEPLLADVEAEVSAPVGLSSSCSASTTPTQRGMAPLSRRSPSHVRALADLAVDVLVALPGRRVEHASGSLQVEATATNSNQPSPTQTGSSSRAQGGSTLASATLPAPPRSDTFQSS